MCSLSIKADALLLKLNAFIEKACMDSCDDPNERDGVPRAMMRSGDEVREEFIAFAAQATRVDDGLTRVLREIGEATGLTLFRDVIPAGPYLVEVVRGLREENDRLRAAIADKPPGDEP